MNNTAMNDANDLKEGQLVEGEIVRFSPLGANVLISGIHEALLFKAELPYNLKVGDKIKAYIKKIRDDGKIDLTFQQSGYKNFIQDSTSTVISLLTDAGGFLPFNDKSDPNEIQRRFGMSKKKFKETIGSLYKKKKISIEDKGIRLV